MKLLIVDDSAMIRRSISSTYQGGVFTEIQTAADGLLAVTLFKKLLPDVVTLDITMPHMDGLAALEKMLEIKPDVHVLVISALADHHTAIEALLRGAEQFICKPFTPEDLKGALDDLIVSEPVEKKKEVKEQGATAVMAEKLNITSASPPMRNQNLHRESRPAVPSEANYPSGYVIPPQIKPPVSLSTYAEEVLHKKTMY